jgi:hypothetical protein
MGKVCSRRGREEACIEVYGRKTRRKRDHYKFLDVYWMMVLKRILEKEGEVCGICPFHRCVHCCW